MSKARVHLTQSQYDRRTWWLWGLALFVILCFGVTVPSLYLALARSGFLGDYVPRNAGALLTGLVGLTAVFCLFVIRQQGQINGIRQRMVADQMELEQSRGRLAELTSLFQLGNTLHMDLPLETIAEITVRRVASSLHSHDVTLFLHIPESRSLSSKATFGLTPRGPEPDVPFGEGAVGWAARNREPLLMRASDKEARFAEFFESHPDAASALILPVTVEKRCVAVIQLCRPLRAEPFRLEHRDVGQLFANNVAPVIDRAQAMARLEHVAVTAGAVVPPPEESATGAFRDVFLSSATTELKSPLTTIVAYSEVLDQNDGKMTPAMRLEFSARLREEAKRLILLIDDVVDLVRLEMGRFLLDLHIDNVNQIAKVALEVAKAQFNTKGIAVDLDLDSSITDQHVDPAKLRQAILHLLRNSMRFSPPKGRVRLTTALQEGGVRIEVRDAGPSIPPEASSAVFDLERNGDHFGERFKDGNNFGLHLTRRFIELHGGQVGAGPSQDGGAIFWILLPRSDDLTTLIGSDPFAEEWTKQ